MVAFIVGRELVPVLVGVVVAARAGSAIAAEIGTMKVSEQIDALRSLAVSPIQYLVVPRLLACVIMLPCLCVLSDFTALIGGYFVSVWQGVPGNLYIDSIREYVVLHDFTSGIIKTVVFGVIVALVSCHQGLITRGGATGVGRATTNAVVLSVVLIYVFDFILAYIMYGGSPSI
jgi:phospholipid/cholesterol/gamma-HCH transport system permease protein